MTNSDKNLPHSAHYFGDQRDFWWNYDFLQLMSERWELDKVNIVLDVGCGVGHWGFTLAPFLPSGTRLYGIDPETEWVDKANASAREQHLQGRFQYKLGTAESIPFEDNFFDMVTCQTVLIHVPDISNALKEMIRVLKPGGLLAVAEPNNIAPMLVFDSKSINEPIDSVLELIRFQMICERGKQSLGLGYISAGDILPEAFSKSNLEMINVYLSDKTSLLIPPYSSKHQQILSKQIEDWTDQEIIVWPKNETKRYFLAGGGSEAEFERIWPKMQNNMREHVAAIKNKTLTSIGTTIMYLISGRKK